MCIYIYVYICIYIYIRIYAPLQQKGREWRSGALAGKGNGHRCSTKSSAGCVMKIESHLVGPWLQIYRITIPIPPITLKHPKKRGPKHLFESPTSTMVSEAVSYEREKGVLVS